MHESRPEIMLAWTSSFFLAGSFLNFKRSEFRVQNWMFEPKNLTKLDVISSALPYRT
jgi:hypothetical protein